MMNAMAWPIEVEYNTTSQQNIKVLIEKKEKNNHIMVKLDFFLGDHCQYPHGYWKRIEYK
jgi:hypothetical protein